MRQMRREVAMVTDRGLSRTLRRLGACEEARDWAQGKNLATAWVTCNRPDWMLWLLDEVGYRDDRTLRLFACWCVRQETCWSLLSDERSRAAVEVAERYARGDATDEELSAAWAAAWAAARAAARAAAWAAARASAEAAAEAAARAAASAAAGAAIRASAEAAARAAASAAAEAAAWDAQADRLREVVPLSVVQRLVDCYAAGKDGNRYVLLEGQEVLR